MNVELAMIFSIIDLTFSCTFGIIYTRTINARYCLIYAHTSGEFGLEQSKQY